MPEVKPFVITSINISRKLRDKLASEVRKRRAQGERVSISSYIQKLIEQDLQK